MDWVLYGANGYTGELIARMAVERGMKPVLAGRSRDKLEAVARRVGGGLEVRAFALDEPSALDRGLAGARAVLHCAGPFARTARPMVDACLRSKAHYLDITGEWQVFEALAARDAEARAAGVMVMPGAGFDVVPSDCLAVHLKARLPSATHLTLAMKALGQVSHGTATTVVENIHTGGMVRRDGKLTPVPAAAATRKVDFGRGPVTAVQIPWGDIATAYRSTGIPNIEVYAAFPTAQRLAMRAAGPLGPLLASGPVQRFLKRRLDAAPAGPTDAQRARGLSLLWGEARDAASGRAVVSRMRTPEGYTLTALTALALVEKVLAGDAPAGFQTPAMAYGADVILGIPGVEREDL